MLKTRVITAVTAVLMLLAALFYFPNWGWGIFSMLIVLAACWEWSRLCAFSARTNVVFLALSALLCAIVLFQYLNTSHPLWMQSTAQALFIAAAAFWLVAVPLWLKMAWRPRLPTLAGVAGWLVVFPAWTALLLLHDASPLLLLSILAIVWAADIGAYFAGKRFGKTKLAPSVSPGKTWEGVVGGLIGVMGYFFLWFAAVYYFGASWARLLLQFGALLPLVFLVLGAVSVIGDLFESWMKRGAGMKDSSNLLPGHGGILDRIDAVTSALPIAGLMLFVLPGFVS
jgi:phosphatidate cytidylyltransferase